jgi:hypothetical protein
MTEQTAIQKTDGDSNLNLMYRRATALSRSDLLPREFQGKPENCMIALNLAERLNADPLMVAQNVYFVHGKPSLSSSFLIGAVNSCGRFSPIRFRWQGEEGEPSWGCRAVARDLDTDEECVGSLITIALANSEGWSTKKGSKWKTMPEQMLMYRAAAFWARVYAPDATMGMHTRSELRDVGPAVVENRSDAFDNLMNSDKKHEAVDAQVEEPTVDWHAAVHSHAVDVLGDEIEASDRISALADEFGYTLHDLTQEQADKLIGMIGGEE